VLASVAATSLLLVGCGTGRVAFDLAAHLDRVLAIDYCGKTTTAACTLQHSGSLAGPAGVMATVPASAAPARVVVKQLTWLPQEIGHFDACLLDRFLERALNPVSWIVRMREVVKAGGRVIVADKTWSAPLLDAKWAVDGCVLA
jgi:SAM-dependent methyltransferase